MDLWLDTPWGEQFKIAPYNFEQYAAKFHPEHPLHHVPKVAYAHWVSTNDYHHLSEFTTDELMACSLVWIGSADEFNENPNG